MRLWDTHQEEVDDDLFSLACGPAFRVRKYSSCIVNGVRFNTVGRDKNKKTQNSGVMTQGMHNGQFIDFFGTLKKIIQFEYSSDERTVVFLDVSGLNWMGGGLNLIMMASLKASILEVYGTRTNL